MFFSSEKVPKGLNVPKGLRVPAWLLSIVEEMSLSLSDHQEQ